MPLKNLSDRHEKFCKYIVEGKSLCDAHKEAGFGKNMKQKTRHEAASRLAKENKIVARLDELRSHHMKRHEITIDRVVHEMASVGYGNVADFYNDDGTLKPLSSLTREQTAAISEIQTDEVKGEDGQVTTQVTKIKLHNKTAALIPLGKHVGAFNDSIALTGANGGPLEFEDKTPGSPTIEAARRIAYALSAALNRKDVSND